MNTELAHAFAPTRRRRARALALAVIAALAFVVTPAHSVQTSPSTPPKNQDTGSRYATDARSTIDDMRRNNLSLARAIEAAENTGDGRHAIEARIHPGRGGAQSGIEVLLIDPKNDLYCVFVDGAGKIINNEPIAEDKWWKGSMGMTSDRPTTNDRTRERAVVVDRSDFSPVVKAEEVIGHSVHNQANESLGKIEDLAIDSNNGRVAYAVLSFGGVLGIGDKLFAVPWSALQRPKSGPYVLDIDKKRLTDAPGFSKDQWPDMSTAAFGQGVYPFYGQTYSEDGARLAGPIVKASELTGREVRNPKNEKLGKIEDLAIAPASGRIRYAVLSYGGILGMGDKLFAVPWSALKHQAENKTITLDVDKDALKRQQGFDKSSWPNMADPDWVRRNAEPYRTAVPSDRDRD